MRFWFEHSSEVSLREQVVTQVTLGILCGELAPGERLPSIRELARRFGLHANTVSAGYRQLEKDGWVESRKGSGVYVRAEPRSAKGVSGGFERLLTNLFEGARRLGISDAEVQARVAARAGREQVRAGRVVLVEPDVDLREIVLAELREGVTAELEGCGFGECGERLAGAVVVVLPSKLTAVKAEVLASGAGETRVIGLRVRSVPESLAERLPAAEAREGVLVGVASRWGEFLRFARTMLVAAGFEPEALMVRDAREPGWREGLEEAAGVVCDALTARELPGAKTLVFRVLAEGVAEEVRQALG